MAKVKTNLELRQEAVKKMKARYIRVHDGEAILNHGKELLRFPVGDATSNVPNGAYIAKLFVTSGEWVPVGEAEMADLQSWMRASLNMPIIPEGEVVEWSEESARSWKTLFPYTAGDETRYFINGVCISHYEGKQCMVATDGCALAYIPANVNLPDDVIIGKTSLGLEKEPGIFTYHKIDRMHGWIKWALPAFTYAVKTIDGKFPNWTRVIPEYKKLDPFTVPPLAVLDRVKAEIGAEWNRPIKITGNRLIYDAGSTPREAIYTPEHSVESTPHISLQLLRRVAKSGVTTLHIGDSQLEKAFVGQGPEELKVVVMPMLQ